jgi:hypothetical protein
MSQSNLYRSGFDEELQPTTHVPFPLDMLALGKWSSELIFFAGKCQTRQVVS